MSTLRERFEAAGQGHVFVHWSALDDAGRGRLEAQLEAVDLPLVTRLGGLLASSGTPTSPDLAPPTTFPAAPGPDRAEEASRALLTGAQLLATGKRHAAVVSNREGLEQVAVKAGLASGDEVAPLPFAPEIYQAEFSSAVADMRNSVKNRSNAQVSCAAEFVHWNVDGSGAGWGHVDLAYPAFRGNRGTGYGVALLVDAVQRLG